MTTPVKPPRIPPVNGRQLSIRLDHLGQPASVVLGFQGAGSWTGAGVGEAVLKAFWDKFSPTVLGTTTVTGATWRDVSQVDGPVYEVGPYTSVNGGSAGSATVAAACVLVKLTTAQGGRSGKGRIFLPGLSTTFLAASGRAYTGTLATTVANAVTAYRNDATLASNGLVPAVLSFRKGACFPITGGALASVVGVQRRRMR